MPWQCHGYNLGTHILRFIVHWEKPRICISSTNMTLFLTYKKKTKIKGSSKDILSCKGETLRRFVALIDNLVAGFLQ